MITREKFDFIKEKYGQLASWAIWAEEYEKPKSNVGDIEFHVREIMNGKEFMYSYWLRKIDKKWKIYSHSSWDKR